MGGREDIDFAVGRGWWGRAPTFMVYLFRADRGYIHADFKDDIIIELCLGHQK